MRRSADPARWETSELRSQEDVADYESDGRIASKQPVSGGYKLGIQIKSNEGDEYTLHQVGLLPIWEMTENPR